jgi:hypothetical protein
VEGTVEQRDLTSDPAFAAAAHRAEEKGEQQTCFAICRAAADPTVHKLQLPMSHTCSAVKSA